jgi:transposase InsO family protein
MIKTTKTTTTTRNLLENQKRNPEVKMNNVLNKLYYNAERPEAYAGATNIIKSTHKKYHPDEVLAWLESQDAFNQHRYVRRRFPRRYYNVRNIDDVWEADLMDVRSIKSYNNGYSYILVVIDVLSKFAWLEPVKDKTSKNVAKAFECILMRSNNRVPVCFQTDKGKEFIGKDLQECLKRREILYRVVRSPDTKAAVAERLIRTIKERLWRYFTHKNTRRYIDILQKIAETYNHSKHSGTRMEPAAVTIYNADNARKNLYRRYVGKEEIKKPKYNVGDLVRVSRAKNVFAKGYEGGWTLELFKISRISLTRHPVVYFLRDLTDEDIEGFFYEGELSKVRKNLDTDIFEVEKIIKRSGVKKKYLVKWKGYPDKFNSWVHASQITNLQ